MSTTYQIFARKEHPQPLTQIGSINVSDADNVNEIALKQFGPETDWLEMIAVPTQSLIPVYPEAESISP